MLPPLFLPSALRVRTASSVEARLIQLGTLLEVPRALSVATGSILMLLTTRFSSSS